MLISVVLASIIVVIGYRVWLNSSYDQLEQAYIEENPNLVYPEHVRKELLELSERVRHLDGREHELEVTGGFRRFFAIFEKGHDFGPAVEFDRAEACFIYDLEYFNRDELQETLADLKTLGYTTAYPNDNFELTNKEIINELSGEELRGTILSEKIDFYKEGKHFELWAPSSRWSEDTISLPARACYWESRPSIFSSDFNSVFGASAVSPSQA